MSTKRSKKIMREGSTGDLLTDRVTWTDGQTTGGRGRPSVTSTEIRSSQIFLAFFSLLLHDLLHQRNPIIDWIFVPPQHASVETHPTMWSYQEARPAHDHSTWGCTYLLSYSRFFTGFELQHVLQTEVGPGLRSPGEGGDSRPWEQ